MSRFWILKCEMISLLDHLSVPIGFHPVTLLKKLGVSCVCVSACPSEWMPLTHRAMQRKTHA